MFDYLFCNICFIILSALNIFFCYLAWGIRHSRNELLYDKSGRKSLVVISWVHVLLDEFWQIYEVLTLQTCRPKAVETVDGIITN